MYVSINYGFSPIFTITISQIQLRAPLQRTPRLLEREHIQVARPVPGKVSKWEVIGKWFGFQKNWKVISKIGSDLEGIGALAEIIERYWKLLEIIWKIGNLMQQRSMWISMD